MKKFVCGIFLWCVFTENGYAAQAGELRAGFSVDDIYLIVVEGKSGHPADEVTLHAFLTNGNEVYATHTNAAGKQVKLSVCREGRRREIKILRPSRYDEINTAYLERFYKNPEARGNNAGFQQDEDEWDGEL